LMMLASLELAGFKTTGLHVDFQFADAFPGKECLIF